MPSNLLDLCNGVVTALNAGSFSEAFTAVFDYAPNYSTMRVKDITVIVTDAGGDINFASRSRAGYRDGVRVVVLWRVDSAGGGLDPEKLDRGLVLLDEIVLLLLGRTIGGYSQTGEAQRGVGEKDKQHYMPANLDERVFAATVVFQYLTTVTIPKDGPGSS